MSDGRLYDKIGKSAKNDYVISEGAICKLVQDEVADCGGVELSVD